MVREIHWDSSLNGNLHISSSYIAHIALPKSLVSHHRWCVGLIRQLDYSGKSFKDSHKFVINKTWKLVREFSTTKIFTKLTNTPPHKQLNRARSNYRFGEKRKLSLRRLQNSRLNNAHLLLLIPAYTLAAACWLCLYFQLQRIKTTNWDISNFFHYL
jgi:hypothetical protein